MLFRASILLVTLALAGTAMAQEQEQKKEDGTLKKAGEIASQPARDVGIDKAKVPEVLARAVEQPYAPPTGKGCKGLVALLTELNEVLGADFGTSSAANQNKFGKLAAAGGAAVINSLIPFRGLVREVSGAAPADRRLDAAVNAGLARRGYLRGIAVTKGCKLPTNGQQIAMK